MVDLALDGGIGQHLRGLLEGRGRQEALRGERRLRDTHKDMLSRRGRELGLPCRDALGDRAVGRAELMQIHNGAGQQVRAAGIVDTDLAHHLADDDLNVLIVDVNALLTVDLLDFLNDILPAGIDAADTQHVVRAVRAVRKRLTLRDRVAVGDQNAGGVRQVVRDGLAVDRVRDRDRIDGGLLRLLNADDAGDLGEGGHLLRLARLEQLFNTRKALRDIVAGDAAGVERTHGQLRARLADGLGGDDADRLAGVDRLADGQVDAVALGADAAARLAGHDAADLDFLNAVLLEHLGIVGHEHMVGIEQHLAGLGRHDGLGRVAAVDALAEALDFLSLVEHGAGHDAVGRTAVILADDDFLRDIDQTTGQITGVGSTQCGIGQALTGASGRDEVLEDGQALTVVGLDRDLDGLAGGVCDQAAHTGELTDLRHGTTGAGVRHHIDRVELIEAVLQGRGDVLRGLFPLGHGQTVALVLGDEAALVLLLDRDDLLLRGGDEGLLLLRDGHVRDGDRDGADGGVLIAEGLDVIEHLGRNGEAVLLDAAVDDLAELLLADLEADLKVEHVLGIGTVDIAEVLRDGLVVDDAADGRLDRAVQRLAVDLARHAHQDRRMQADIAVVIGHDSFIRVAVDLERLIARELAALSLGLLVRGDKVVRVDNLIDRQVGIAGIGHEHLLGALLGLAEANVGQVVCAEDHILRRHGDGVAVLRAEEVVCREHEDARLGLRLRGQRNVDSHLVAVKVGVERGAAQGVQLERTALDEHGLERLDAQTVERRRAVEHDRVVLDDDLERVPDLGALLVDHFLGGLDVVGNTVLDELFHDERAEELDGHFLRHAALIELQIRADDDNASAGVVDTLAEQVLTEAALLALEHIRQGLERAGVGAGDGTAAAAVVDQGVNSFLQHALLVADDDVRRVELHEALEAVVAVDDAAIQVVEVGRGKTAAVELDHGAKLGRDDRQNVNDHPLRTVAAAVECLDDLQALDDLRLLLAAGLLELGAQLLGELGAVDLLQELLDGLGAHAGLEIVLILLAHVAVLFFGQDLAALQRRHAGVGDDIRTEIQHLFQHARGQIQDQAHARRDALEVPDVAHGRGQLDVAHALAADLCARDFDAAAVADLALVADLLILAAVALPVLRGSENALAEQAVTLGLERAVVDGLGLFHFAGGPGKDHFRGGNADLNCIKRGVAHVLFLLLIRIVRVVIVAGIAERAETVIFLDRYVLDREAAAGDLIIVGLVGHLIAHTRDVIVLVVLELDLVAVLVEDAHIQAQGLQLLDEHLERLRHARLRDVLALDDGFVRAHTAGHVVGLHRQDLLQGVSRAVGLERPDFHFAEALAAELRLAAERLLRDEAVGAGAAGVDLIIDEVVELEEVDPADRDVVIKLLAGAAVVQHALAVLTQAGLVERLADGDLVCAVEDRRCDLPAERLRGVAQMHLEHLTDVHTGRHAQRVEDDIERRAVRQVRHILAREDAGHDTLVAMAAGHLVADGDLTLLRDVDAHDLVDAGRHLVAVLTGEALDIDHDAGLAVRDFEGSVADLSRLFAEDGAQ